MKEGCIKIEIMINTGKLIDKLTIKKCSLAKRCWPDEQCKEDEELQERITKRICEKIKELTQRRACRSVKALKNKERKLVMEMDELKKR